MGTDLKQQLVFLLHTEESHLLFLSSTLLLNFCSHVKGVLQDCPSSVIVSDVGPGDDGAAVRPKTKPKHTFKKPLKQNLNIKKQI